MGLFERLLTLWVLIAIAIGIYLGDRFPSIFIEAAQLEVASINIPIAIFIWLMIFPMMLHIDFSSLLQVGRSPKGLLLTLAINWCVKPFTMAAIAWFFFNVIYDPFVPTEQAKGYIAGMILLGVAPCTAMVFVWSQLVKGDANYTLAQVSINDLIMVFAFAPISAFLLGVNHIEVPWQTLLVAVILYIILPLIVGVLVRATLLHRSPKTFAAFCDHIKPFSIVGLILTVILLFGFQAQTILNQTSIMLLIAIPLIFQTLFIFALTYAIALWINIPFTIAAPASFIGTSNFFELAVAVAIALFGLNSGAALATVVGVLVEVPLMLCLVSFAKRTKHWFKNTNKMQLND
ncbi:MAG: ACR3 family arsenite efflux transporter [Cellvibrionales bacterium]|nr:ACR3 family arsenite efflux transporter [Cellvibrionales bacterium]